MNDKTLSRILMAYDLKARMHYPTEKGYRNTSHPIELDDGRTVNFIMYKNEPGMRERVRRINAVTRFLADRNLPVRAPIDNRIMALRSDMRVTYGALYDYLPGSTIPWDAYTKDHLKLVGMAMSTMHFHMREHSIAGRDVEDEYKSIVDRMRRYFMQTPVRQASQNKLQIQVDPKLFERFLGLLTVCRALSDRQILHMDFVRGNLLFESADSNHLFTVGSVSLVGIIDFEKTAVGHPLFDIARTLAFLMVDCQHKDPTQVRRYFLQSGYNKRGLTTIRPMIIHSHGRSLNIVESLIDLFLFYDFYKFLLHNPYESLHENIHFIRTKHMLFTRGVLQYA